LAQLQQVLTPVLTGLPAAPALLREVQVEHPTVRQLGLNRLVRPAADSLRADTTVVVSVRAVRPLPVEEQQRMRRWLILRAGGRRKVELLVEPANGSAPPPQRGR
jgi:hypothetical protein